MLNHKKILLICITFFVLGISGLACAYAASQRLIITGSSTVAPLVGEIARRFEAMNSGVRIDVQTGGSSRGVNDARNGTADIGMISRALKPDETDLHAFTIALDGISMILHTNNRVNALSKQQITDIYTGKISNWKSAGGADARITVVNKAEGRATLELFLHYLQLKNSQIKPHTIIGDNQQGIKTVAGNPNAIGYVSIGAAEYEVERGALIKLLPLDGVAATVANMENGVFPLSRPLNLITTREPQGLARRFIEFAQAPENHDLIKAEYFGLVPAKID